MSKGSILTTAGFAVALFLLLLGFVVCGYCHELPMVSVPLGFEIYGFDSTKTWVSQNGVFAFGFLDGSLRDDIVVDSYKDGLYVGIRYNLGSKGANRPVWTAGGGLRVSENSTLRLASDGRLELIENPDSLIVWNSNTSNLGVRKASLLDNGNLVLLGERDEVLWETFNSPTTALLPAQPLHFPQTLGAPSTKSISSYYSLVIRRSGQLALLWESNVTYWRSLPNTHADIKEARFDSDGVLSLFDDRNVSVWSASSKDVGDPSVKWRHLRIDPDGNLRIYSWDTALLSWKIGWQAVDNQCHVFGACGLYSVCGFNSTGPVCNCLYEEGGSNNQGVGPMGVIDSSGSSLGCKKLVDLANCNMPTSMMVLKHTVLYGLYPPEDVDIMLNEDACKEYCAGDASCIAVTSRNDGTGLCTIKRTSFVSGYANPSVSAVSFLKVCLVPQAVSAQKAVPSRNPRTVPLSSSERLVARATGGFFVRAVALIGLGTALGCLTVQTFVFWFVYQRRKSEVQIRIPFRKDNLMNPHCSVLTRLTFEEIKELTANFSTQLGPSVFKGILPNSAPVIAKVLYGAAATWKDFGTTVSVLGATHHRNLVPLKGFCFDQKHRVLLYEYVLNDSLDKWLFNWGRDYGDEHWQRRLDIALGVARAIAYLHTECRSSISVGNLKAENVMLDENLVPKLMDFGLERLVQEEPSSSESPSEVDIYRFGKILLQIVTCKEDGGVPGDDLQRFIDQTVKEHKLESVEAQERVEKVVRIALWCMQNQPFLRPSIGEVIKVLEGTQSVDRPPSNFALRRDNGTVEEVVGDRS